MIMTRRMIAPPLRTWLGASEMIRAPMTKVINSMILMTIIQSLELIILTLEKMTRRNQLLHNLNQS